MKFKLVQNPYGREMGFKQDIVWFIQGTDDNKTWNFYRWGSEIFLKEIMSNCEIKKLVIDSKVYVDD